MQSRWIFSYKFVLVLSHLIIDDVRLPVPVDSSVVCILTNQKIELEAPEYFMVGMSWIFAFAKTFP